MDFSQIHAYATSEPILIPVFAMTEHALKRTLAIRQLIAMSSYTPVSYLGRDHDTYCVRTNNAGTTLKCLSKVVRKMVTCLTHEVFVVIERRLVRPLEPL